MIIDEAPDDDEHEDLDNYIHAQLLLDVGNEKLQGQVTQRLRTPDGTKKGKPHKNPMFDTRAYLDEPAFYWWVRDVLRKRQRIIGKLKSKYWRTTHKFGICLPKDAREALQIDEDTGTDFWKQAIEKELRWVKVAWEARDDLDIEQVHSG